MPLHWNLKNIKNYEDVCFYTDDSGLKNMEPLTNQFIWLTMFVDIGEITEENAAQFYARVSLLEKLNGAFMWEEDTPYFITYEDVKKHIGLSTNVYGYRKGNKGYHWAAKQAKHFMEDQIKKALREEHEKEVPRLPATPLCEERLDLVKRNWRNE